MTKNIKNIRKDFEKKNAKNIEIFLKNKETKDEKRSEKDIKIFLKWKKKKKRQYQCERNKNLSDE